MIWSQILFSCVRWYVEEGNGVMFVAIVVNIPCIQWAVAPVKANSDLVILTKVSPRQWHFFTNSCSFHHLPSLLQPWPRMRCQRSSWSWNGRLWEAQTSPLPSDWPFTTASVDLPFYNYLDFAEQTCTGGCDGCLNLDNKDNAGLGDLVASLESLYQEQGYSDLLSRSTDQISIHLVRYWVALIWYLGFLNSCDFYSFLNRADYWALAGIVAVDKGIEISNVECGNADDCLVPQSGLVFQWGRQVSDNISLSVLNSLYFERIAALLRTPPSMWACQEVSSTTLESWASSSTVA